MAFDFIFDVFVDTFFHSRTQTAKPSNVMTLSNEFARFYTPEKHDFDDFHNFIFVGNHLARRSCFFVSRSIVA